MVGQDQSKLQKCEDGVGADGEFVSLDRQQDSPDGIYKHRLKSFNFTDEINSKRDEVRRVLIFATLICDNDSRKVAFRFLDWNFTVAKLREDLREHTLQCFASSQNEELFQQTVSWKDADGNAFTLDDDQLPLRNLCEWKNFEGSKNSKDGNDSFVSDQEDVGKDDQVLEVQFSCFRDSCPSPSLVEKILSIAVGKQPLELFQDYQSFLRSDPTFETQRASLNSFAAKEGGFSGADTLPEIRSFRRDTIDGEQIGVNPGVGSVVEKCIFSTTVDEFLRVSVSGFTRFAHSDPLVGPEKLCYLEAALYYGIETTGTATTSGASQDNTDKQRTTSSSSSLFGSFPSTSGYADQATSFVPPQMTSLGRERWSLSPILRSTIWDCSSNNSRNNRLPEDKYEFEFPVSISELPRHTKLCITYNFVPRIQKTGLNLNRFFFRLIDSSTSTESSGVSGSGGVGGSASGGGLTGVSPNTMYSKNTTFRSDAIVDSYVIIPLFNSQGYLNVSLGNLVFWRMPTSDSNTNVLHSPIGTVYPPLCRLNQHQCQQHAGFIVRNLVLEHQQGNLPIKYRSDNSSCSTTVEIDQSFDGAKTPTRSSRFLSVYFSRFSTETELIDLNDPAKVARTLSEMDWANKSSNDDLQSALDELSSNFQNHNLPLHLCLHYLTYKCVNQSIRNLAVMGLQKVSKSRIRPLLPALIQGLKFEDMIDSPLARFLLSQAVSVDDVRLGYEMCWSLLIESENALYRGLYLVLLETLLRNCAPKITYFFLKALMCDREMSNWARSVQTAYKQYSPEAAHYSFMRNLSYFEAIPVPFESVSSCFYLLSNFEVSRAKNSFKVPLCNLFKPAQKLEGIRKSGCKIMNSKKLPLWITLKKKNQKNKDASPIHRAQTFCFPNISRRGFGQENTENKSATLETFYNGEQSSSRLTMTNTNPNFLGVGNRNGVNLGSGSRSSLNSSKDCLTDVDAKDYPDIKMWKDSSESESGVSEPEDSKLLNIRSHENIHGVFKSKSLRLPKRISDSHSSDGVPTSLLSRTNSSRRKTESTASEFGPDKISQKLTRFHDQTSETSVFERVMNHLTDATHSASLYDIRWASLRIQKAEIARVRAGTQGPEMIEVESFDLASVALEDSIDQSEDFADTGDVSDNDDSECNLSQLEKTVMLEPVGFIEDSFGGLTVGKNKNNRRTTVSRHWKFSLYSNSDDVDSASYNLNSSKSSRNESSRPGHRPSVELKSYRRKKEAEETDRVCELIYKSGDDLRQDMLIMRAFELMLDIWSKDTATNKIVIKTYGCIATSENTGAIEVVQDAVTLCRTQKIFNTRLHRNRMTWDKDSLKKWLQENNQDEDWPKVKEKFFWSALGSCVATFILGIGDRHSDNMMIQKDGTFLHIDFGHMLGNFKKFKMIARETTPFFFTPDIVEVIGGFDSGNYAKFRAHFWMAYLAIREHASLFISMFQLMLGAGMPELRFPEHVNFLTEKTFMLQLTPHMNSQDFVNIISENNASPLYGSSPQTSSVSSSANVNEEKNMMYSRITDVVNAAASNQRQILNQKIHQLK